MDGFVLLLTLFLFCITLWNYSVQHLRTFNSTHWLICDYSLYAGCRRCRRRRRHHQLHQHINVGVAGDGGAGEHGGGGGDPTARAVGAEARGLVLPRAPPYFVLRARF